jgi:hypothetical protein
MLKLPFVMNKIKLPHDDDQDAICFIKFGMDIFRSPLPRLLPQILDLPHLFWRNWCLDCQLHLKMPQNLLKFSICTSEFLDILLNFFFES